jgi:Subtilase family
VAPELSGCPVTVPGPVGKQDPLWHPGSAPVGDRFFVKFAWSRPAALRLAREIGVLTALAREPKVPGQAADPAARAAAGHRRGRGRFLLQLRENLPRRPQRLGDHLLHLLPRRGLGPVLEPGELGNELLREQITASGQQLAELGEGNPALFQGLPQRHRERGPPAGGLLAAPPPAQVRAQSMPHRDTADQECGSDRVIGPAKRGTPATQADLFMEAAVVARRLVIAGAGGLLIAGAALALASVAQSSATRPSATRSSEATPLCRARGIPPPAERIAATTATYNAIEARIAAGRSLRLGFPDPTAREDIIDYGNQDLWKRGIDGACVTVAYVVTNPDPGLAASMASYDKAMDLPPANITEMALPPPGPSYVCQIECDTGEDRLDAEAIHSMAPYANIVFVHPPVPETVGMQGWPQVAQAIEMIADQHLADVITVSLGDGENDFIRDPTNPTASQQAAIHSLDPAFLDAAAHNIPVMFASGDCGPTDAPVLFDTGQCTPPTGVTAGHPVDSPWVTAVGGTIPNAGLATPGGRTAPDALWAAPDNQSDAESAGVSAVYPKPSWQQGIPALNGVTGRAFPDIAMDASDGTSQASPTFAGILALATQLRGADLGTVNPALAAIGPRGAAAGIIDVPAGYTDSAYGVTGFSTATGYDIASGWGTVYAPAFVPALVAQIDRQHGPGQPSWQARDELNRLQANISASADRVASGQAVTITGHGFIPGRSPNGTTIEDGLGVYPPLPGQYGATSGSYADPASTVPGQTWDDVTAALTGPRPASPRPLVVRGPDGNGTVTVTVTTTGMAAGTYTVTITGRLLTQTISFQVGSG